MTWNLTTSITLISNINLDVNEQVIVHIGV